MMRTRHAFLFLFLLLAQGLAVSTDAHAHGDTVKVVITGQREGHVTTEITWENDGDPVEEAVAATVNAANPDGSRTMGPWRLVRDAGTPSGWSTTEVLPPGTWKVTVDVGFPDLGHGESEIAVPVTDPAPSTAPSTAPTTEPSPVASPTPSAPTASTPQIPDPSTAPVAKKSDDTVWWTTAGVVVIALAGAAVGILLRRARARRR
ncbi:hypothetical protein [Streptomyces sp. H27-H5]|uniref:hypothetical protein n=1 Tax=Streptomyces sp. H27-H5 TaxID=2996460 RepID=UPI002270341A|nr:hypothetical protein [Streptomyces sp. H27-H5]MCY0963036.1 hypothetical protein [Streptomyces sp. H27-H5]